MVFRLVVCAGFNLHKSDKNRMRLVARMWQTMSGVLFRHLSLAVCVFFFRSRMCSWSKPTNAVGIQNNANTHKETEAISSCCHQCDDSKEKKTVIHRTCLPVKRWVYLSYFQNIHKQLPSLFLSFHRPIYHCMTMFVGALQWKCRRKRYPMVMVNGFCPSINNLMND